MTDLGRYHFLPWLRRGIGTAIPNADTDPLPLRSQLDVVLTVSATLGATVSTSSPPGTTVFLYGPGDVVGIDPNVVVRTEPRAATSNYEPSFLTALDFGVADFPWLFTPAINNGDRLRPWIALIALKSGEFVEPKPQTVPLPSIGVTTMAALQDLTESWAWAHVQITNEDDVTATLASDPGHALSRLICPRRLEPETSYDVFLVPAFEPGRRVGLGLDLTGVTTSDPAWKGDTTASAAAPFALPFYFRFAFHTSDEGDFESLVRRLVPQVLPATVGTRPVAVDQPGPHLPSAGPPLGFDGALIRIGTQPTAWTDPARSDFQTALETLVNLATSTTDDPAHPNAGDPRVVPPIYGRWHAGVSSVDRTQTRWIDELNLDPRNRTPGGFGTEVVQTKRTALLASAWQQVAGVLEANRLLRQAQLARATMVQLYTNQLKPAAAATLLRFTAPIQARILGSPQTVLADLRASRIPERMVSAAFRRVTRPLGPLRRRQAVDPAHAATLLTGVNDGTLELVPPAKPPAGTVGLDSVSEQLLPAWLRGIKLPFWLLVLIAALVLLAVIALVAIFAGAVAAIALAVAAAVAVAAALPAVRASLQKLFFGETFRIASLTPGTFEAAAQRPAFALTAPGAPTATVTATGSVDSAQANAFRTAATSFAGLLSVPQPLDVMKPALDLAAIQTTLLARLDPTVTIPKRLSAVIDVSRLGWKPPDPIQPIMAAPAFDMPMYAPLRDLSENYICPGADQIPPDSIGLLEVNHAFIEAYMVGLNHEMARQLLVNGYPTDQRGSYFRQFWDVSAYVPQPGDPTDPAALKELLRDIPPINTWPLPNGLGQHENRTGIVENNLVLIVRGELLRRYPNTIIFAGKAVKNDKGEIVLDESAGAEAEYKHPIFSGTLGTDITFLGFNLTAAQAGGQDPSAPLGYYFAFQQVPTEPRFGLEPSELTSPVPYWSELAWTNFATGGGLASGGVTALPNFVGGYSTRRLMSTVLRYTQQQATLPPFLRAAAAPHDVAIAAGDDDATALDKSVTWGKDSAQNAYILLRRPFRIMASAKRMLPS